jgi:hypothetical protein
MQLRKTLAVLLCVAAVFSVMAMVAVSAQTKAQAAAVEQALDPSYEQPTTTQTASTSSGDLMASLKTVDDSMFKFVQNILLWGFRILMWITGLWPFGKTN